VNQKGNRKGYKETTIDGFTMEMRK
jgi:hypothetical protein